MMGETLCTCQLSPVPLDRIEHQVLLAVREMRMRRKPGQIGKVVMAIDRDDVWHIDIKLGKTIGEENSQITRHRCKKPSKTTS